MRSRLSILTTSLGLAACATAPSGSPGAYNPSALPAGVSALVTTVYDGVANDLLTAGLGKTGIGAGAAPAFADAAAPTPAELRRNAIHGNYRALVDGTAAGGYGTFYGPNVDAKGNAGTGEGKIAGSETLADYGKDVTLMVQIPVSFDAKNACIVTAASSGSRGIYGAIGTAGDWGLKRGCAVAYTDKGSGNGAHDLMTNAATQRNGAVSVDEKAPAIFRAELSAAQRAEYNQATPNRVAYKHAHSQTNPEKDWGEHTLAAVRLAFYLLNQKYGVGSITPANTIVIASSVSNGARAALAAAEQDKEGLIDGVAVSEPQVAVDLGSARILQGGLAVANAGKPLLDYFTYANLYQPCAALSTQAAHGMAAPFWPAAYSQAAQERCTALAAKGLLKGATTAAQADESLAKLNAYGWLPESNVLHGSHFRFATNSIVATYLYSYGRFSVTENLCGYSFANTNPAGEVIAQVANTQRAMFATGNGIPPTAGVNVVYNGSVGGAKLDFLGISPSTGKADFSLDAALCARSLATGQDAVTGAALGGAAKAQSDRIRAGMTEANLTAKLQGKPTIIVSGRADALIPVNHAARAYLAKNSATENASNLRYIEVTNAQHFDTFMAFGAALGYDTRFVPLGIYFNRAMDAMYEHLKNGTPLPASQVVRTTPRAPGKALEASNVPAWSTVPAGNAITANGGALNVPQ